MKHESHDWNPLLSGSGGQWCDACGICTCHSPEKAAQECDRALLRVSEPMDSGTE